LRGIHNELAAACCDSRPKRFFGKRQNVGRPSVKPQRRHLPLLLRIGQNAVAYLKSTGLKSSAGNCGMAFCGERHIKELAVNDFVVSKSVKIWPSAVAPA